MRNAPGAPGQARQAAGAVRRGRAPAGALGVHEDAAEIEAKARDLIAAGGEGVVVKRALSTYRRIKSGDWQRIRRSLTLDVPITGFYPLRENADALGSLEGELDGVRFKVAAGFSDAERAELWRVRESLVGAYMEVQAMEITEKGKPRQAVWEPAARG
jgi:ATP-dependent DNA ligase